MGQAQGKSGIHPREPTLERDQTRGAQSPRSRKTAQEGGLPRESGGARGKGARGRDQGDGTKDQRNQRGQGRIGPIA